MPLTRRAVLLAGVGSAGFVAAAGAASYFAFRPVSEGFPSSDGAVDTLRDLTKQTGRDAFQLVSIDDDGSIWARLLMAGGGTEEHTYKGGWKRHTFSPKQAGTSPSSATIADLPLDRLGAFRAAVPGATSVDLEVDHLGKVTVAAFAHAKLYGLKPDGTGTVPEIDTATADGVRAAIVEIFDEYAGGIVAVGAYGGEFYVDAIVAGPTGARITRGRRTAASAALVPAIPYDAARLFDPRGFDPARALSRVEGIAAEAGVAGKVYGWSYSRPPQGGEPAVSFLIGTDTRVWLDPTGKVAGKVPVECPAGTRPGPAC